MSVWIKPTFATVWEITQKTDRYAKVRLGTSRKDKDGNYINSNWFASFVGNALQKIDDLDIGEKTRIVLLNGYVCVDSVQKDGEWKNYTNMAVFDIDLAENFQVPGQRSSIPQVQSRQPSSPSSSSSDDDTDEYPF
jgi:hypothetical protein